MIPIDNEILGIIFLLIAGALMLLMFHAWKYPYDKDAHRSSAPRSLVWLHRLLGYLYLAIYLWMMWDMVPRLWTYQVELPARTVAHLLLGMAIGGILIVKIAIVRFFKHMEAKLVPVLGTGLFLCTLLLVSLALPLKFREAYLRDTALMGDTLSEERLNRVKEQLPKAGLDDPELLEELATADGLLAGRAVLLNKCVQCHDLRTVLARPRTPESWRQTVRRMADRSATAAFAIQEEEEWQVTAYLVAISPTLQRTLQEKRKQDEASAMAQQAALMTGTRMMQEPADAPFDVDEARARFETTCSQCHPWQQVEFLPPGSKAETVELVQRMVRNGLSASEEDLATVIRYINATYVQEGGNTDAAADTPNPDAAENPDADEPVEPAPAAATETTSDEPVDAVLTVNPLGEDLRFEQDMLTAKAGSRVRLVFQNTAAIDHNLVLVKTEEVSDDVVNAAYGAAGSGFVPEHDDIVAAVPLTAAGSTGEAIFDVPEPGKYRFICTFPGHSFTMKGTLESEE